jgi:hypothetical protein
VGGAGDDQRIGGRGQNLLLGGLGADIRTLGRSLPGAAKPEQRQDTPKTILAARLALSLRSLKERASEQLSRSRFDYTGLSTKLLWLVQSGAFDQPNMRSLDADRKTRTCLGRKVEDQLIISDITTCPTRPST